MDIVDRDGKTETVGKITRFVFFSDGTIHLEIEGGTLNDAEERESVDRLYLPDGIVKAKTVKLNKTQSFYKTDKPSKGYVLYLYAPSFGIPLNIKKEAGEYLNHFKGYKFRLANKVRYGSELRQFLNLEVFQKSEQTPFGKTVEYMKAKLALQGIKTKGESWVAQLLGRYDLRPTGIQTYYIQAPQTVDDVENNVPVNRFRTDEKIAVNMYRMGEVTRLSEASDDNVILVPTEAMISSLGHNWWQRLVEDYRR